MGNLVAIVGRPNVGKSTLFNRLTKTRQAIVNDEAGTTRDRQYGKSEWLGREFSVVDTGGWVVNSDDIFEEEIRKQVLMAVDEADVILFVVDVTNGVTDLDMQVAAILRRAKSPVIMVANKTDNHELRYNAPEFYRLGLGDPYCISAISGSGTGDLMDLSAGTRAGNAQQWFFTQVGVNCEDLYNQAMEVGAYHYAGAAKFFRAYGFMMLADLFGEIPYSDAFGDNPSPTYDNGKEVFLGCIADIDEAIELFSKTQDVIPGVQTPQLVEGDSWNFGDSNKWLKMCYLLKARWLNHLSKKQAGDYLDGKYDAEEILACLAKGPQSNDAKYYCYCG